MKKKHLKELKKRMKSAKKGSVVSAILINGKIFFGKVIEGGKKS